jgi:hypothetical protein
MKLIVVLFLMVLTPLAFSQNEWWKTDSEAKEQDRKKVNKTPQTIAKVEPIANDSTEEPKEIKPGKITVVKSPSINKLIKFKSATIPPNSGPTMDGYRIQLFFDQDRDAVDKARSTALLIDSETSTYIEYKAPNYLLLLGDYRSQLEAEKARSVLTTDFPEAIVVEDKIYLPTIKEDLEEDLQEED